ncbi:SGNH/GDSL hydrolase family protein [Alteromonas sp. 1_MG-2023]|uniref:SGNH/GDSL hydrolase family protein n=1 Tax=Alteromonas sp. 1_MG-2023 TaxID=3062669 RepID=UPI0026E162E1|nr:SGNH/GDSL hydrolase family protein [Alteromonas sp. 1_MG-2023]MDO6566329.1 SGNH/GDSL hydrolase family protein [Alteromonas sp. 1_MG-2023]
MKFNFLFKKKKLLVLGDSHAEVFRTKVISSSLLDRYNVRLELVHGATISGIENPNSKTKALPIFQKAYELHKPDLVIILLGEVDTGFVLWFQSEKKSRPIGEMLDLCVEKYIKFIDSHMGKDKTVVISAPLPTIKDAQDWGEIANARKEVRATQLDRTALTIELNKKIEKYCVTKGLIHVNLDPICMGDDGTVSKILLNEDANNHHYDNNVYAHTLLKELNKIFK